MSKEVRERVLTSNTSKCHFWQFAGWLGVLLFAYPLASHSQRFTNTPIAVTRVLHVGGASIQVDIADGALDLSADTVMTRVTKAAQAVTLYYGRFPVENARVLVVPVSGEHGVVRGTTWGDMRGFPGFTKISLGQHTTDAELSDDWTITHELVHMALPQLPDAQHWMEEGMATYVEPIARVEAGELKPEKIWNDMLDDMPKGEPGTGDRGLDRTHTWGRTYWGGALFCLMADVTIRQQTGNRKGLQDALRAIAQAGGIDHEGTLPQVFFVGDEATGTHVMEEMYRVWSESPESVDLAQLASRLGVHRGAQSATFDDKAPWSDIRKAITAAPVR